jgi:hypothetical protein
MTYLFGRTFSVHNSLRRTFLIELFWEDDFIILGGRFKLFPDFQSSEGVQQETSQILARKQIWRQLFALFCRFFGPGA